MSTTPEQLTTTGRRITGVIWCCAALTMLASFIQGTSVFDTLTTGTLAVVVGMLTALVVDAFLAIVLIGDARMHAMGLTTRWGRVSRIVAAGMSLTLNSGASVLAGHWFLAVLHAFCPTVIVLASEYGQDVALQFAAARHRHREAEEAAERESRRARDLETHRVTVERELAVELERKAEAASMLAEHEEHLAAAKAEQAAIVAQAAAPVRHLTPVGGKSRTARDRSPTGSRRSAPVRGTAVLWLIKQRREGRDITQIPAAEIVRELGVNPHTVKASHKAWKEAALLGEGVAG